MALAPAVGRGGARVMRRRAAYARSRGDVNTPQGAPRDKLARGPPVVSSPRPARPARGPARSLPARPACAPRSAVGRCASPASEPREASAAPRSPAIHARPRPRCHPQAVRRRCRERLEERTLRPGLLGQTRQRRIHLRVRSSQQWQCFRANAVARHCQVGVGRILDRLESPRAADRLRVVARQPQQRPHDT